MRGGEIHTLPMTPIYMGEQITLGDILEKGEVDSDFFLPEERLYYTDPEIKFSDETKKRLPPSATQTWQYLKGGKKILRKTAGGHSYVFNEGSIPMVDEADKPARTMMTTEGRFHRGTHIVRDYLTGKLRLLTPTELERIQGFPTGWTQKALVGDSVTEISLPKRRTLMGNALVVDVIRQMEPTLSEILEAE